jgi:hypothetical protein
MPATTAQHDPTSREQRPRLPRHHAENGASRGPEPRTSAIIKATLGTDEQAPARTARRRRARRAGSRGRRTGRLVTACHGVPATSAPKTTTVRMPACRRAVTEARSGNASEVMASATCRAGVKPLRPLATLGKPSTVHSMWSKSACVPIGSSSSGGRASARAAGAPGDPRVRGAGEGAVVDAPGRALGADRDRQDGGQDAGGERPAVAGRPRPRGTGPGPVLARVAAAAHRIHQPLPARGSPPPGTRSAQAPRAASLAPTPSRPDRVVGRRGPEGLQRRRVQPDVGEGAVRLG